MVYSCIVFKQTLQGSWELENKSDFELALVNANDLAALVANDPMDKNLYSAVWSKDRSRPCLLRNQ